MQPTPQSSHPWVKWLVIVVAVVVVGSGAWYAFGFFAAKGAIDALNNSTERSAPEEPGNTEPATYFPAEMLGAQREFDSRRQEILGKILTLFAEDNFTMDNNHMYEGRSIQLASPDLSAVAILDRNSAKNTFLTTNPNLSEALSQIAFAARPGTPAYQNFADTIKAAHQPGGRISADEDILIQSKYFDNGKFVDESGNTVVIAKDTPTQIISAMSQRERTNTVYVFQWDKTADGKGGDWRVISAANKKGHIGYVDPLTVGQVTIQDNP